MDLQQRAAAAGGERANLFKEIQIVVDVLDTGLRHHKGRVVRNPLAESGCVGLEEAKAVVAEAQRHPFRPLTQIRARVRGNAADAPRQHAWAVAASPAAHVEHMHRTEFLLDARPRQRHPEQVAQFAARGRSGRKLPCTIGQVTAHEIANIKARVYAAWQPVVEDVQRDVASLARQAQRSVAIEAMEGCGRHGNARDHIAPAPC